MSQYIPENEMAHEDNPNWMQQEQGVETLWKSSQDGGSQWPTYVTPLPKTTLNFHSIRQKKPTTDCTKKPLHAK